MLLLHHMDKVKTLGSTIPIMQLRVIFFNMEISLRAIEEIAYLA